MVGITSGAIRPQSAYKETVEMVIRRLKSAVKFGQDNNELRFGEGDFRLGISGVEKTSVDRQSRTGQIMAEIYSKSQFTLGKG